MIPIGNLDLGHLIDTLNYLATPTAKRINEGLPHVLVLAVPLVNLFGWMGQGDHSKTFLILALYCWSTPSCLKVIDGWVGGWGGGPCDYCVSPSPNNWVFGFFRLGLILGSGFVAYWDRGLGTWTWALQFKACP